MLQNSIPATAGNTVTFYGGGSPADLAVTVFPAVAGMEFWAVAEDLSLADDAGGLPSGVRVSEPLRVAAEQIP